MSQSSKVLDQMQHSRFAAPLPKATGNAAKWALWGDNGDAVALIGVTNLRVHPAEEF
ncbi:hypothetical protein Pla52o_54340 [Novipirellula galeiformis]|uniref:Uncharacterized protein n=1 Tax=Novipirellula galeiformis TaxID=2528004 RepID=A0A5C6BZG8_9BACT|nr:hypothetical protein [Novipirellula galeiformis]TWU17097.1 hypothetical protein Pla52o_54340 [Novipirellula galeiformis]